MFFVLFLPFCIFLVASEVSEEYEKEWETFVKRHEKCYDCAEKEADAKRNFLANLDEIEKHNHNFKAGKVFYSKDYYHFSDMLHDDALEMLCGTQLPPSTRSISREPLTEEKAAELFPEGPDSVDWREFLLPVQNQKVER